MKSLDFTELNFVTPFTAPFVEPSPGMRQHHVKGVGRLKVRLHVAAKHQTGVAHRLFLGFKHQHFRAVRARFKTKRHALKVAFGPDVACGLRRLFVAHGLVGVNINCRQHMLGINVLESRNFHFGNVMFTIDKRLFVASAQIEPIVVFVFDVGLKELLIVHHSLVADFDNVARLHEVAGSQSPQIRFYVDISRSDGLLGLTHILLGQNVDHLRHDTQHAFNVIALTQRCADVNRHYAFCAHIPSQINRQVVDQTAVNQDSALVLGRSKCPRHGH